MKPMEPMKPMDSGSEWWPDDLGQPGTSGSQDDIGYAFFPDKHCLAINQNGKLSIYDSGDHHISGVSQQKGSHSSLTFTSQRGEVKISELKQLS